MCGQGWHDFTIRSCACEQGEQDVILHHDYVLHYQNYIVSKIEYLRLFKYLIFKIQAVLILQSSELQRFSLTTFIN